MSAKEFPKSKPATDAFREGHKAIWGEKKKESIWYECPECGYRVPPPVVAQIAIDPKCPRCDKVSLSQFKEVVG